MAPRPNRIKDMMGKKFGRITPLKYTHTKPLYGAYWDCVCDCGTVFNVRAAALRSGNTKSCGCLAKETSKLANYKHGLSSSHRKEQDIWQHMKARCYNPRDKAYHNYGGRGIYVSNDWLNNFKQFIEDMGPRPNGYSLERIDNNGPYSKENCKWATRTEQASNTRQNVWLSVNGVTKNISQWAAHFKVGEGVIRRAMTHGPDRLIEVFEKLEKRDKSRKIKRTRDPVSGRFIFIY